MKPTRANRRLLQWYRQHPVLPQVSGKQESERRRINTDNGIFCDRNAHVFYAKDNKKGEARVNLRV